MSASQTFSSVPFDALWKVVCSNVVVSMHRTRPGSEAAAIDYSESYARSGGFARAILHDEYGVIVQIIEFGTSRVQVDGVVQKDLKSLIKLSESE